MPKEPFLSRIILRAENNVYVHTEKERGGRERELNVYISIFCFKRMQGGSPFAEEERNVSALGLTNSGD